MIAKDILKYAQEHRLSDSGYKKTITEISKSGTSKALVESSKEIFCFDDISRDLYKRKDCLPTSADGMIITDNRKIYSGRDTVIEKWMHIFDYIKLGSYREELGTLDSVTTNQRMYRKNSHNNYEDITHLSWSK